jgi:hypothetical protein
MSSWPSLSASLYIAGQLMRLNNSVKSDDTPTELSHYSGGHTRKTQPHITGYHQVLFFLPETLFGTSGSDSQKWLHSTCDSYTPHSYNINMGDVSGIGQVGVSYPISRTTNREFTLGFKEYRNLPILSIIKAWHSLFDPLIGTSPFGSFVLTPLSYKGVVVVASLKPTSDNGNITTDDLEEAYIYEGVYPISCPEDTAVASDYSSNDTSQLSVTFKFDGAPLDLGFPGVSDLVVSSLGLGEYSYNTTYNFVNK